MSSTKSHKNNIIVYTDGSFSKSKNGIKAGYGIYFPNKEHKNYSKPFTHEPITNQRAELYAIYKTLSVINKKFTFDSLHIYTDSEYSIKSLTIWIKNWKKNNWKGAKNKEVLNQDIIKNIDLILEKYKKKIFFHHVRSHTGKQDEHSIGNDMADQLATQGANK